ncbi:MAG: hypothetical protein ABFC97_03605 [Anaerolineaceae bacterium]
MRKSEKIKSSRFTFSSPCTPFLRKASKFNAFCFAFRYLQIEFPQSLNELLIKSFSIFMVLEEAQKVIGIPDEICLSPAFPFHFDGEPQVQYIVQVYARQSRRYNSPPCGVPISVTSFLPCSMIPALRKRTISRSRSEFLKNLAKWSRTLVIAENYKSLRVFDS